MLFARSRDLFLVSRIHCDSGIRFYTNTKGRRKGKGEERRNKNTGEGKDALVLVGFGPSKIRTWDKLQTGNIIQDNRVCTRTYKNLTPVRDVRGCVSIGSPEKVPGCIFVRVARTSIGWLRNAKEIPVWFRPQCAWLLQ